MLSMEHSKSFILGRKAHVYTDQLSVQYLQKKDHLQKIIHYRLRLAVFDCTTSLKVGPLLVLNRLGESMIREEETATGKNERLANMNCKEVTFETTQPLRTEAVEEEAVSIVSGDISTTL